MIKHCRALFSVSLPLLMAGTALPSFAQSGSTAPWVGTWATPPENMGSGFGQVTVREFVHTSVGGTAARIRLSNEFGTDPLVVQDIHIARRNPAVSGGIMAGTDHAMTFSGSTSVTIPVGAVAISDPVAMTVPALSDISVSFFLPASGFTAVTGQNATFFKPSFLASGDVSGATTLPAGTTTQPISFFLDGLDVQGTTTAGAVVALGASITGGVGSDEDLNDRWTDVLAQRLSKAGMSVGVLNSGISGDNSLNDAGGPNGQRRFNGDVTAQAGVEWVMISDFPINNFGSTPATAADPIASLKQFIARAHERKIKVLCADLTPFKGSSGWTADGESGREAYNAFVLGGTSGCDGTVDVASAVSDPKNPQQYLPAFDSGDHLHPNAAGHAAIGNAINLALFH
ncbi:MAG TPA: GDSL-type esterase/lipase family protein [Aliidongia sp.]|nr:GDSL-type esterase/lipase family protein [Aliidongia sp.]